LSALRLKRDLLRTWTPGSPEVAVDTPQRAPLGRRSAGISVSLFVMHLGIDRTHWLSLPFVDPTSEVNLHNSPLAATNGKASTDDRCLLPDCCRSEATAFRYELSSQVNGMFVVSRA